MKKKLCFLALGLALVCLGVYMFNAYQKAHSTSGQSITLRGHYTCLEYKSQKHVDFCAYGFSSGSKVYQLDSEDYYKTHRISFIGNDEYIVTGFLQPPGSSSYVSDGTIKVTDIKLVE